MVGKREKAAKTLVRMEAIAIQGVLMGAAQTMLAMLLMSFAPFVIAGRRWRAETKERNLAVCVLMLPLWFVAGGLFAVTMPLVALASAASDLRAVMRVEWASAVEDGQPLSPSGHPVELPDPDLRAALDADCTLGVIRDYNAEARVFGQGLPIDESRL